MSDSVKKWEEYKETQGYKDALNSLVNDDCSFTYLESEEYRNCQEGLDIEPLDNKAQERKNTPVFSGVIKYFPLALKEIAKASAQGQKQHNPDKPLAWDRSKSGDELDAMMRHLLDHASGEDFDDDGVRHIVKCGWRILAFIQKTMENEGQH